MAVQPDYIRSATDLNAEIRSFRREFGREIYALRLDLNREIHSLRTELNREIQTVCAELKHEVRALRADPRRGICILGTELDYWFFALIMGQAATLLAAIDIFTHLR